MRAMVRVGVGSVRVTPRVRATYSVEGGDGEDSGSGAGTGRSEGGDEGAKEGRHLRIRQQGMRVREVTSTKVARRHRR